MKELKKQFSKLWWGSLFTSLIFFVVGLMLVIKPSTIITLISMIVGIAIIIAGIFAFVKYFKGKEKQTVFRFDFIYGVICMVCGILLVFNPEAVASILPLVLGIWMIVNSMMKIEYVLSLKDKEDKSFLVTIVLTVISLACGILFVFNPFKGATILTQILGFVIMAYALMDIINSCLLKKSFKQKTDKKDLSKIEGSVKDAVIEEE